MMTNLTKKDIDTLTRLQQIGLEIEKLVTYLEGVPVQIKSLDTRLDEFNRNVENDEHLITELNKKYRTYESDIQSNASKIEKSQDKLRSVKTNKEYQSSLKEIDDIKAINSKLEDEMLEFLEQIERAEQSLSQNKQQYSRVVDDLEHEKTSLIEAAKQGEKKLAGLKLDQDAVAAELDPKLMDIFRYQLSKHGDRIGIVEVINEVCQGCYMNIPPQMYNELQRGISLKYCPSCERIIYWQDQDKRSE
ncbi:MAG: C4-type zinc ribbon domain-containing protein [Desulfobacteraceae bacterium]|jgi:predicted  nucleic acid-binding Zn-ribbon protein|nr:C4-type zinc ribbon domain-containing protein [Desulfobacteraceae bacterium]